MFLSEPFPEHLKYEYGFSKDGLFIYGMTRGGKFVKVWSLSDRREISIPAPEGRGIYEVIFLKDGKALLFEVEREFMPYIEALNYKLAGALLNTEIEREPSALAHSYYRDKPAIKIFMRAIDFTGESQDELTIFSLDFFDTCFVTNVDFSQFFKVHKDGSITETDLTGGQSAVRIFDAVPGFELSDDPVDRAKQCSFLSFDIVALRDPKDRGFIIRSIKEKEEFLLPHSFFVLPIRAGGRNVLHQAYFPFIRQIQSFIKYPFAVKESLGTALHIPSGQEISLDVKGLSLDSKGRLSTEVREIEGQDVVQIFSHPLNPYQRKKIFEIPKADVCGILPMENRDFINISSYWGDLFFIDIESGAVRRQTGLMGMCSTMAAGLQTGRSEFMWLDRRGGEHTLYRIYGQCVEPAPLPADRSTALIALSEAKDITSVPRLELLTALLNDETTFQDYPRLIRDVMRNALIQSPALYLDLQSRHPGLNHLMGEETDFDFSPADKKKLLKAVKALLESATSNIHFTRLSHWSFLRSLSPLLRQLPDEDQNVYMERITVSLSTSAAFFVPALANVFQSKIYYAVAGHVRELFGRERKPVSDITIAGKQDSLTAIILSSDPIEGRTNVPTDFGLHYAVAEEVGQKGLLNKDKNSTIFDSFVEWSLAENKGRYRADVKIKTKFNLNFFKAESPDYDSVWMDHKMAGVIIVGSSLREYSSTLLNEYISYFEEEGFLFSGTKNTDLKAFLLERIENCEVDYFLKESHSDGDERNVFRFDRQNHIVRGVRYGDEGRIEAVYLIFPRHLNPKEKNTEVLSHLELSKAISERARRGCGQITYFNTSCWSHIKARSEISAVNSFLFLNIPVINLSDTFLNTQTNALRILLDSYRKGLDFDGFRTAMEAGNLDLKVKNRYIFPDEALYTNLILKQTVRPLEIHIQLERREGETWEKLEPDEALQ